jgi:cytoskeleton protein RodZ
VLQDRRSKLVEVRTMMSTADDIIAPTAARVGADMRAARERLGWELSDIARHLRIRRDYLDAIEVGQIASLPGHAYAVGFVRSYATALGLDPDEIGRRFRAEAAQINRKTTLTFPAPVPERGVPAGAVVLLSLVLCVGAYVGWYRFSSDGRPAADVVQPVPERLVALVEPAPVPPVVVPPVVVPPVAAAAATPAQIVTAGISTNSAAAAMPPLGGLQLAAPVAPPASPAPLPGMPDGTRIVLRAKADAWMQVRDPKGGQVLLNRILRAGETWPVPAKTLLMLDTGNAGGTEMLLDGVVMASLGGDGVVRRNLALDPDQIRDGKLAVLPPAAKPPVPVPVPVSVPVSVSVRQP